MLATALACGSFALRASAPENSPVIKLSRHRAYQPAKRADLERLVSELDPLIAEAESRLENRKAERKQLRQEKPFAEMSFAELKSYFGEPAGLPTNNELRALRELRRLASECLALRDAESQREHWRSMAEVARSIDNLHRTPMPEYVEVLFMPFTFLDHVHNPVCKGRTAAANICACGCEPDLSRVDPPDSTFWKKPKSIADADLYHSLERDEWPDFAELLWEYHEPKTSSGGNPGFEVKHGALRLKVKFAEVHSEPFAARVFSALGYHADQTDFVPALKIKYDRRLFREFHLRKEVTLKVRMLRVFPSGRIPLQKRYDAFDFIAEAVLKDGTRWSADELRQRLLRGVEDAHPEDNPSNFDANFEEQIDYLITAKANVQLRDEHSQSLGHWEFGGLGHESLRELRGAGLIAAWLGWFDSRFDNTRVKVTLHNGTPELRHYFSDLGGGFGKGTGVFSWKSEHRDLFEWTFTEPRRHQGPGRMTIPFRIVHYRPIQDTPAFKEMTFDDARWMGRMIGQFTEEQMLHGLVASGLDSADARLYAEKLISRRDRMIQDLELESELGLLRPGGVRRDLWYEPTHDGPVKIILKDGAQVAAPVSSRRIVNGRIVE